MAGLKKGKKDTTSPNTILVVFLIFFVMVSIGLGVFAYYGYEGQEKLRDQAKNAKAEALAAKAGKNDEFMARIEAQMAIVGAATPEDTAAFKLESDRLTRDPESVAPNIRVVMKDLRDRNKSLGTFQENEQKYPTTYEARIKVALDAAEQSNSQLVALKAEHETFKTNYDTIVKKYNADLD